MSNTKIIQYVHRPNRTELGQANTHETYLLVDAKTNLSDVFPIGIDTEVKDIKTGKNYGLKSSGGNGSEFRINQMGPIYRDYSVMPGDEITITHFETNDEIKNVISVKTFNRVVISIDGKGVEIINIERLENYLTGDREYSLLVKYQGKDAILKIAYLESKKKRSDSPTETDFYSISVDDVPLLKNTYYLNLGDYNELVCGLSKSEYNKVIIEEIDGLNETNSKSCDILFDFPLQQIFYGAPGTGKSHEIKKLTKGESVIRTTFHPDSDYSTFVGCYKPTMDEVDTQVVPVVVKSGISLQDPGTYKEKRITYKFVMQAFLKAYLGAWKKWADAGDDGVAPQFLVIEEINRGNCAQIFGDLFQLLDRSDNNFSEYPIEADTDLQQEIERAFKEHKDYKLTKAIDAEGAVKDYISNYDSTLSEDIQSGRILLLPPNLYIWATMNTSDQSLFPIDSAFKRRWDWRYIKIAEGRDEATRELLNWTVKFDYKEDDKPFTFECSWWEFIKAINEKIAEATSSDDKKLGYFFCKPKDKNSTTIDEERFVGKVVFYLWNDVFKDEENPIFNVNEGKGEPSFDAFYKEDVLGKTVVDTAALRKFMHNVFGENKDQYTEIEKSEE